MTGLTTLHLFADDYTPHKSWDLARWCKARGADEWTVAVVTVKGADAALFGHFDEAMNPYRLPNAPRRHLTARRNAPSVRTAELWKLTSASLAVLQTFLSEGIFIYQSDEDAWLEDLTPYRQGGLMLGIVSHEAEGILRVTAEERQPLERDGFPFRAAGAYVGH